MADEKVYTSGELKVTCVCGHADRQHVLLEGQCVCAGCVCQAFVSLAGIYK
jgi:hypothetical protein